MAYSAMRDSLDLAALSTTTEIETRVLRLPADTDIERNIAVGFERLTSEEAAELIGFANEIEARRARKAEWDTSRAAIAPTGLRPWINSATGTPSPADPYTLSPASATATDLKRLRAGELLRAVDTEYGRATALNMLDGVAEVKTLAAVPDDKLDTLIEACCVLLYIAIPERAAAPAVAAAPGNRFSGLDLGDE